MQRIGCILLTLISFTLLTAAAGEAPTGNSGKPEGGGYVPLISSRRPALPLDNFTTPIPGGKGRSVKMPPFRYYSTDFDIPLEVNEQVWGEVEALVRSPGHIRTVLERINYYMPLIKPALFAEGCPRDLAYLAKIESNFNPTARSVMDAAGLWQFMLTTAEKYGLNETDWIDERLDIVKSTHAAGRFMLDLYDQFGNWPLALAAYNAGPGAVCKAIKKTKTKDFWKIAETKLLKPETIAFVPRFYAALLVCKYPERFGIKRHTPPPAFQYEEVEAPPFTDIYVISRLSGAPYELLANLNAQYLYECTPPWPGRWPVRIPKQFTNGLEAKLASLSKEKRNAFMRHRVRRGQSLPQIARAYRMNPRVILQANGLSSWRDLRPGMILTLPVRKRGPAPLVKREPSIKKVDGRYYVRYIVGEGDTLWKIARAAGVTVNDICKWNHVDEKSPIYPGQSLVLFCTEYGNAWALSKNGEANRKKNVFARPPSPRVVYHTLKQGQSLSHVARKYNVTVKELARWNGISDPDKVRAGQRIKIYRR